MEVMSIGKSITSNRLIKNDKNPPKPNVIVSLCYNSTGLSVSIFKAKNRPKRTKSKKQDTTWLLQPVHSFIISDKLLLLFFYDNIKI